MTMHSKILDGEDGRKNGWSLAAESVPRRHRLQISEQFSPWEKGKHASSRFTLSNHGFKRRQRPRTRRQTEHDIRAPLSKAAARHTLP